MVNTNRLAHSLELYHTIGSHGRARRPIPVENANRHPRHHEFLPSCANLARYVCTASMMKSAKSDPMV